MSHFKIKLEVKVFMCSPDATTVLAQRVFSILRLSWICGSVSSYKTKRTTLKHLCIFVHCLSFDNDRMAVQYSTGYKLCNEHLS